MTVSFTMVTRRFHNGTLLGVRLPGAMQDRKGIGTAINTQTVDVNSSVTFTGLTANTPYEVTDEAVSHVYSLTVGATAGQFRLRYGGVDSTADQAFSVTAGNLQTALRALPSIGGSNVTVTGGPGDAGGTTPYVITLAGTLANTPGGTLEVLAGTTPLSGGAGATVAMTTQGRVGGSRWVGIAAPSS